MEKRHRNALERPNFKKLRKLLLNLKTKWNNSSGEKFGIRYRVLCAFIATSVGFGQIWRISKFTEEYSGYFLLMYGLCLVGIAPAIVYAQAALSLYARKHLVKAYNFIPLGKALAFTSIFYSFCFFATNNQLALYTVLYTFRSFIDPFPWHDCSTADLGKLPFECSYSRSNCTATQMYVSVYYWLGISGSDSVQFIDYIGKLSVHVFIYSVCAWTQTYFSLFHSKNVTYVVAGILAPLIYIIMTALFVFVLTKEGALDGLKYVFDLSKWYVLTDVYVWTSALAQSFYVMGAGMTYVSSIYSTTPPSFPSHLELSKISVILYMLSILSSCFVASVVGIVRRKCPWKDGEKPNLPGPGWLFVAYSEVLTIINSHFVSIFVFFFFMEMCLTTSPILINSLLSNIFSMYPRLRNNRLRIGLAYVFLSFIITLPMLHEKGLQYLYVMLQNVFKLVIFVVIAVQLFYINFFYGLRLFCEDLAFITKIYPNRYYRYVWMISPFLLCFAFVGAISYHVLQNVSFDKTVVAMGGTVLMLLPLVITTATIVYKHIKRNQCKLCIRPDVSFTTPIIVDGLKRSEYSRICPIF